MYFEATAPILPQDPLRYLLDVCTLTNQMKQLICFRSLALVLAKRCIAMVRKSSTAQPWSYGKTDVVKWAEAELAVHADMRARDRRGQYMDQRETYLEKVEQKLDTQPS
ncbi:hypothetical protein NDU88_004866 [Pleurodeles waltl]|uniref:Uncharacterized protein n=1 Tax=Pleurodeles waltl TaxID=8319 RepID=A0AAV7V6C5_PLEWA|nr:hypothetical protein NDU88_004866 [Pleurodeles waltl]